MKKGFIEIITLVVVGLMLLGGAGVMYITQEQETPGLIVGAPTGSVRYERELTPETDSKFYLGTTSPSTKAWLSVVTDEVCLTGDACRTSWPVGGSGGATFGKSWELATNQFSVLGLAPTTTVPINVSSTATSTISSLLSNIVSGASGQFGKLFTGQVISTTTATSTFAGGVNALQLSADGLSILNSGIVLASIFQAPGGTNINFSSGSDISFSAQGGIDMSVVNDFSLSTDGANNYGYFDLDAVPEGTRFHYPAWGGMFLFATSTAVNVPYLNATSTTATSTFAGGISINQAYGLEINGYSSLAQITGPDHDTGIGFDGPDIYSIHTGGVNRMYVTATGNIGIATTAPSHRLSIQNVGLFDAGTSTMYSRLSLPTIQATSTTASSTFSGIDATGIRVANFLTTNTEEKIFSITVASTSPYFIGGTNLPIVAYARYAIELTHYRCWVQSGTSVVLGMTDGTNPTETITCATTLTSDTDVATNDTFTVGELKYLDFGTVTGAVDAVTFEAYGYVRR